MKRVFIFLLVVVCQTVFAHGPTPQKLEQSISIEVKAEEIWEVIKDFQAIANWHPMINKMNNNESSSERTYSLKGKEGELTESLDEYSEQDLFYSYRLLQENIDVIPVSFHSTKIEVVAMENNTSKVNWEVRFYRADTGNFPPEHLSDEAAVMAMEEFASSGLQALKSMLEKSK